MGVGRQIKKILDEKGVTIKDLALMSGVSLNTLYSITKRDSNNVGTDVLQRLTSSLAVNPHEILGINEDIPKELLYRDNIGETYYDSPDGLLFTIYDMCQKLNSKGRVACFEYLKSITSESEYTNNSFKENEVIYAKYRNAVSQVLKAMKDAGEISSEDYQKSYLVFNRLLYFPYTSINGEFEEPYKNEHERISEIISSAKRNIQPLIDSGELIDPFSYEEEF